MFGAHLSVAGGLVNALFEAERLKFDCVQVFTKNQRQWRAPPLDPGERDAWLAKLRDLGWHRRSGPARVVSHSSYLINMASPDDETWQRSIALQRIEVERCEALRIPLLVAHPGAHLGAPRKRSERNALEGPFSDDETRGIERIAAALDRIHDDLPGFRTLTCLETTVGSGTNVGYRFEHLAAIRDRVREPERVAFCLDTCHVTAAGYDMTTSAKAEAVLRRFNRVAGRGRLKVLHLNDSVGAIGSRTDRHAHIGYGECGIECFRTIVNRASLAAVPKILETPKDEKRPGLPWDVANVRRLKGLMRRPR